ncbi:MAG: hypothetical protein BAJALOKI2v1_530028 [Promethearchaeota archaeon]|nr:MAG: hypothetical protein BAJALOKI2v1_530028 [Candidatus Lokiarchaeota archaeon]
MNINTPEVKLILCDILNGVRVRFLADTQFLFQLVKVARVNVDFLTFCLLIRKFATMNTHFKESFLSVGMFKNLILGVKAGENFKISTPRELRFKLKVFNKFTRFEKKVSKRDILDDVCNDYIKNHLKAWKFYTLIFMIVDAVRRDRMMKKQILKKIILTFEEKKQEYISSLFYQNFIETF